MKTSICFNANKDDLCRREALFKGDLLVYSASEYTQALAEHAKNSICEYFGENPPQAQFQMTVNEFVKVAATLKTVFTNSSKTSDLVRNVLYGYGCDLQNTYFDVPRLRIVTHGGYLSAGIGYAYKPHRDNWYGSPECQVNWWMPVFDVSPDRAMGFFPRWWDESMNNTSADFDYDEWCSVGRKQAVNQVKQDMRKHPLPKDILVDAEELRVSLNRAEMLLFSAAHLHHTAPNSSGQIRFSLDFRTVHIDDLEAGRGAPNLDNKSTGTTLIDFRRASDLSPLSEAIVKRYRRKKQ
mgnify:CR=1 FL=1